MIETAVNIASEGATLAGTLVLPDAPRALVIFVHGSGPLDRDENSRAAKLNVFNTLAAALAEIGIASFRYDKRGVSASSGDFRTMGQADLIADIRACIAFVHERGLGPVYLCGHSEGSALAPAAAVGQDVAGLVLICPYVMPGPDLLHWQAKQAQQMIDTLPGLVGRLLRFVTRLMGGPVKWQGKLVERVMTSRKVSVRVAGKAIPVRWMRDFLTADVAAVQRSNARPTLVLVAARDCQCPPGDGTTVAQANPKARLVVVDDLSHLLRHTTTDGFADYRRQLTQPMDPRVAQIVCNWMTQELRTR